MPTIQERLNAFRRSHSLTHRQLADALSTPLRTLHAWTSDGKTPPAVMLTMLDLIENDSRIRAKLGLSRRKEQPRGRPFEKGHCYRFNDPRRSEAIAESRKRKRKKKAD